MSADEGVTIAGHCESCCPHPVEHDCPGCVASGIATVGMVEGADWCGRCGGSGCDFVCECPDSFERQIAALREAAGAASDALGSMLPTEAVEGSIYADFIERKKALDAALARLRPGSEER